MCVYIYISNAYITHTHTHTHTHIGAQHIFQDLRVLYDVSFLDIPEEEKQLTGTEVLALLVQKYLLTGTKKYYKLLPSSMTSAFFFHIPSPAGRSMRTRMRTHIAACGHVCGYM